MSQRDAVLNRMTAAILSVAMRESVKAGEFKTEGTYKRQLWRVIRELFNREIDEYQFIDDMSVFIDNQFTRAWNAGAREVGVLPGQMKDEDLAELARLIDQERMYMLQLADDILNARMNPDATLAPFKLRAEMWANRYNEMVSQARMWFGGKIPLEWVVGPTEHCEDCARLEGIVATAEDWRASKWRPQGRMLDCGGWRCQCSLQSTDKDLTRTGIPI